LSLSLTAGLPAAEEILITILSGTDFLPVSVFLKSSARKLGPVSQWP
jgi:hypothetical protein